MRIPLSSGRGAAKTPKRRNDQGGATAVRRSHSSRAASGEVSVAGDGDCICRNSGHGTRVNESSHGNASPGGPKDRQRAAAVATCIRGRSCFLSFSKVAFFWQTVGALFSVCRRHRWWNGRERAASSSRAVRISISGFREARYSCTHPLVFRRPRTTKPYRSVTNSAETMRRIVRQPPGNGSIGS